MIRLNWYNLRHLLNVYQEFDGDILLAIVLGEIAHHNICRHFTAGRRAKDPPPEGWDSASFRDSLEPCNPYSLSVATGIPRETVRRKIATLLRRKWVHVHPEGGYVIALNLPAQFRQLNAQTLADFLQTAAEIMPLCDSTGGKSPT